MRAYEQLMRLEIEFTQNRMIYKCPAGHHDDLAMSCAMLVWAAQHPHLPSWCRTLERRVRRSTRAYDQRFSMDVNVNVGAIQVDLISLSLRPDSWLNSRVGLASTQTSYGLKIAPS